ncbi:Ycf66 family protein [cf. Phormidesmis sp. LEGE 11477]|uniref:Ycf66 family protein n=1 Tax=cf. Phormidesmis sp. LEGE 11477 TaxID=1828680 RepID=UPI0018822682|nr:hypothetical protein [cf. Phormidesmis sp. LEGE 11477]
MNFGTPVPLLIGIILILGALALFFLEKFRPGYERDSDKVYAVLLLISGLFLLAHLDMELLASFQQLLMAGMLTTLLIESIRSRLPKSDPLRPPTEPMVDRRPPRPRYDDRPPVRRGYRAELDDRPAFRDRPPADLPPVRAGAPRMNPAQAAYWPGEYPSNYSGNYPDNRTPRQPYEEYRGPAGRLQPSSPIDSARSDSRSDDRPSERPSDRFDGPPDNRYTDNAQYGQRPPAPRPPARPVSSQPTSSQSASSQPPERAPERSSDYPSNRRSDSYQQRPENRTDRSADKADQPNRSPNGAPQPSSSQNGNNERTLNIRPYSEAPKLDDDYRSGNRPEGTPSEY